MKTIIYAGIGLFSAAAVYGVVDYYGTSKSKIDKMYKEEIPVVSTKKEIVVPEITTTKTIAADTKTAIVKTTAKKVVKKKKARVFVRFSDFSRGRIVPPVVIEDVETPVATKEGKDN